MIFDCFLYNGEIECLKIRLKEFEGLPVTHILVESDRTFTGIKKTMYFSERDYNEINAQNLVVHKVQSMSANYNAWMNEAGLRNQIAAALKNENAQPSDVVIISDADEIVLRNVVLKYNSNEGDKALVMDSCGYYLNCLAGRQNWNKAKIMPYSFLQTSNPEEIRNSGSSGQIDNAGWHFSWMGGVERMIEKFFSFSHQEEEVQRHRDKLKLEYKVQTGQSLWGEDYWQFIPIDETFPEDVKNNSEKYKNCIYELPRN